MQKLVINTGIGGGRRFANGLLCGNKSSESGCLMQDFCTANQRQTLMPARLTPTQPLIFTYLQSGQVLKSRFRAQWRIQAFADGGANRDLCDNAVLPKHIVLWYLNRDSEPWLNESECGWVFKAESQQISQSEQHKCWYFRCLFTQYSSNRWTGLRDQSNKRGGYKQ